MQDKKVLPRVIRKSEAPEEKPAEETMLVSTVSESKISGGTLWDAYFDCKSAVMVDSVFDDYLNDSGKEMLETLMNNFVAGEAMLLRTGIAIGLLLLTKED